MQKRTDQEYANLALQFLGRAEMKGAEVPVFNEVASWLDGLSRQVPTPQDIPDPKKD